MISRLWAEHTVEEIVCSTSWVENTNLIMEEIRKLKQFLQLHISVYMLKNYETFVSIAQYTTASNRPFLSCIKPLFKNEVKGEAFDMEMSFILMHIKLFFTKKASHLTSQF